MSIENIQKIKKIEVFRYSLPLHKPLQLSSYCLSTREVLLLRGETDEAECWAEISPLPGYSRETLDDCLIQLQKMFFAVTPTKLAPQKFSEQLKKLYPSVSWALAMLFFSECDTKDLRICPLVTGDRVELKCLTKTWQPAITKQTPVQAITCPPFLKLKVGGVPVNDDIARINHILTSPNFRGQLRLDANKQWAFNDILAIKKHIDTTRIQWFEDPLLASEDYTYWHQHIGLPFAYDETLYASPFCQLQSHRNLVALILKPSLLGFNKTLQLIEQAHQWQCNVIFSSSFESPLGLKKIANFSKTHSPNEFHGLDTLKYFSGSLTLSTAIDHSKLSLVASYQ